MTFGHWSLAYAEMLLRDARPDPGRRGAGANECPLGSGALSGTPLPIDRERLAKSLGFDRRHGELPRRGLRPRRGGRVPLRRVAPLRAPLPDGRGPDLLHLGRGGLRRAAGRALDRLLADAAEEEPRPPRARARPRRSRDRRADRLPRAAQGAPARVRQGPPARQGTALPDARRPGSGSAGAHRAREGAPAEAGADGGRGRGRPALGDRARRRARAPGRAVPGGARDRRAPLRPRGGNGEGARGASAGRRDHEGRPRVGRPREGAHAPRRGRGNLPEARGAGGEASHIEDRGRRTSEGRVARRRDPGNGAAPPPRQETVMKLPKGFLGSAGALRLAKEAGARRGAPRRPGRGECRGGLHEEPLPGGAGHALSRGAEEERRPREGRRRQRGLRERRHRCRGAGGGEEGPGARRRARRLSPRGGLRRVDGRHRRASSPTKRCGRSFPTRSPASPRGGLEAVSRAILTTDAAPKVARATFRHGDGTLPGRRLRQGRRDDPPEHGDDARVRHDGRPGDGRPPLAALKEAVDGSFNAISVDGDTSTNDTVLLLASGKAGGPELKTMDEAAAFRAALAKVCGELAWRIVRDGEGAKRVMEITIEGAATEREAKAAAHAVATSSLVKTALYGGDPNWGRILAAIGRSGARVSTKRSR